MVMAAVVLAPVLSPMSQSDADLRVPVLYDPGNGDIEWIIADGDDIDSILNSALSGLGMEYVGSGGAVVIDGLEYIEVGRTSDGGSFTSSGTTGVMVRSEWHVFGWTGSVWTEVHDLSVANTYSALSVAFYPDGVVPVADPECMYPMVMFRGDALNRSDQTATVSAGTYEYGWNIYGAALSSPLYADGKVYYKFGEHYIPEANPIASGLVCIDPVTGGIFKKTGTSKQTASLASSSLSMVTIKLFFLAKAKSNVLPTTTTGVSQTPLTISPSSTFATPKQKTLSFNNSTTCLAPCP